MKKAILCIVVILLGGLIVYAQQTPQIEVLEEYSAHLGGKKSTMIFPRSIY